MYVKKEVAYIDIAEWNKRVMYFMWMALLTILSAEIILFIMYQPVPECNRVEYFKIFVLTPTLVQGGTLLGMEVISRALRKFLGEQLTTVFMILGQFIVVATLVVVHNSVPFMCMTLFYPVIFTTVYRGWYVRYISMVICVAIYAAIKYDLIPSTTFQPTNSKVVYIIIFAGFALATIICTNVLSAVVVGFNDENQKLKREKKEIIEKNSKDSMTGLYHHQAFYDKLNEYLEITKQFSMIIIDIDDFKRINDTYGHAAGDRVILQVVEVITKNIRPKDIAARYGGEEFAVLLPDTKETEAYKVAEQIREDCAACKMTGIDTKVTISLGVTEANEEDKNGILLFKEADTALYEAKRTGKNKTICRKH